MTYFCSIVYLTLYIQVMLTVVVVLDLQRRSVLISLPIGFLVSISRLGYIQEHGSQ